MQFEFEVSFDDKFFKQKFFRVSVIRGEFHVTENNWVMVCNGELVRFLCVETIQNKRQYTANFFTKFGLTLVLNHFVAEKSNQFPSQTKTILLSVTWKTPRTTLLLQKFPIIRRKICTNKKLDLVNEQALKNIKAYEFQFSRSDSFQLNLNFLSLVSPVIVSW